LAALLALLTAVSFGVGDFVGGIATRRASAAVGIAAAAQLGGLAVALALLPLFPGHWDGEILLRGALAGLAGTSGVTFLYRGMARGRMGLVAPVTAVGAAIIPAVYGLVIGERPSRLALVGVAIGIAALPLLARSHEHERLARTQPGPPPGLVDGILSGIGFALFFIILDSTGSDTGVVPLVVARLTTVPVFWGLAAATGETRLRRPDVGMALAAGAIDMMANAFFLGAVRLGYLTLVSVIASLYPGFTVGLARVLTDERIERLQGIGLVLAGIGISFMAAG
jgi:drug/metabolite transporter (DMT)-like permease